MKIAISSTGPGLDDQVDMRFGRCPYFIVVEVEDGKIGKEESFENSSAMQMGGAGISSAQFVADKGVNAIITGNVGPRAFQVFSQFGIEVYTGSGKISEVLEKFSKGELKKVEGATGPMFAGNPGGAPGAGPGAGRGMGRGQGMGRGGGVM
ncbi:MAG: NifB/NifX family molybdenum-iron cluster-binding protein [Candidatus Aenigmarchaeota archaeon]|nr:NifB/NifX family molybdenum-iron cluster-binding protein [Candidatus Aenigmarchaeota archaeon]